MLQREFTEEQDMFRDAYRKFLATEIVPHMEGWREADLGVQLHGGAGYMDEYPISRQYTDAKVSTIYAGSSELMKLIIGRDCLSDDYVPFNTRNF